MATSNHRPQSEDEIRNHDDIEQDDDDDAVIQTPADAAPRDPAFVKDPPENWNRQGNNSRLDDMAGVSVYHLCNTFLPHVEDAGFSRDSTIYELENLKGPPGLIRKVGRNIPCPITGEMGAAYVHCLQGEDHVGRASHMLSYTWW
jgi:hypothetical protein